MIDKEENIDIEELEKIRKKLIKHNDSKINKLKRDNKKGGILMMVLFSILIIGMYSLGILADPSTIDKLPIFLIALISMNVGIYLLAFTQRGQSLLALIDVLTTEKPFDNALWEEYRKAYRELVVSKVLNKTFAKVKTDYYKGIPKDTLKTADLISKISNYSSKNYFIGEYKSIPFEACDINISHSKLDEFGNVDTIMDFVGQYYIFNFNKKIDNNLRVIENPKSDEKKSRDLIFTEDEEFNKIFSVFCKDKHTAFYILTPSFMEKLKELVSKLDGEIRFSFIDNKLHIIINNHDSLFEGDPYLKDVKEMIKDVEKDIEPIITIIDTLKLDNDLFK